MKRKKVNKKMNRIQKEKLSYLASKKLFIQKNGKYDLSKDFKKEWNYVEFIGTETVINNIFKPIIKKMGLKESVTDYLGLAYTSSGQCAEFTGHTNNFHYLTPNDYIISFLLNHQGHIIIQTWDSKENTKFWMYIGEEDNQ